MLKLFFKFLYGSLAFYFNSEGIPVPCGFGDITMLICLSSATEGGESVTIVLFPLRGRAVRWTLWRDDNCTLVVYCFVEICKSAIFSAFLECWRGESKFCEIAQRCMISSSKPPATSYRNNSVRYIRQRNLLCHNNVKQFHSGSNDYTTHSVHVYVSKLNSYLDENINIITLIPKLIIFQTIYVKWCVSSHVYSH